MSALTSFKKPDRLFRRYVGNPILTPSAWPYPVNAVFNPAATEFRGETLLLVRVEDLRGFSHFTVAKSKDGKANWCILPYLGLEPDTNIGEEQYGLEDPRIVWLEEQGKYAITYVSFSRGGPLVSLMMTEDFQTFDRMGPLLPPEDKDASLFPRRFKGRFALIHRPIIRGEAHIWICFSPDLKHWGDHRVVIPIRPGWWDCHRVGLGAQPMETREGWLIIYHGVRLAASGGIYRVGLALLDLDEPWKLIFRTEQWVLSPTEPYEQTGNVPGVVFPTGAIVNRDMNELRLYYGAADTVVALATADLAELIQFVKQDSREEPPEIESSP
ncbi:MAG: glycosidase [bacterium]